MRSNVQNFTINQGASFKFEFSLSNADGSPRDLSDSVVRAQLRKAFASRTSVAFTVDLLDPEEGTIQLTMSPETTSTIRDGRYVYDVLLMPTDEEAIRVLEGIVVVLPGVTRDDIPEEAEPPLPESLRGWLQ
jgi:hypothetical protein